MRLSTKSRYGLRALFDIAYNSPEAPVQIQDLSRRQQISPRYLEQIFQSLKRAGILNSKRGPQGGYSLSRTPDQITVLDILNATEQDVQLVECVRETKRRKRRTGQCRFDGQCVTQSVWSEATEMLNTLFSGMTLETLCQRGGKMGLAKGDNQFSEYPCTP